LVTAPGNEQAVDPSSNVRYAVRSAQAKGHTCDGFNVIILPLPDG
jgi:hypothetical protein